MTHATNGAVESAAATKADVRGLGTELRTAIDELRAQMAGFEERMARRIWRAAVAIIAANAVQLAVSAGVLALITR